MSKTYITMTTIKNRFHNFEQTIPIMVDSADKVFIKVCGTLDYPEILNKYSNIELEVTEDRLGSEEKFHGFDKVKEDGYIFTCDDDILYTSEYFTVMKDTIDRYGKKCGVSLHCGFINFEAIQANYYSHRNMISMYHALDKDTFGNAIFSVTAGYHTSTFKISPKDCPVHQMDDAYATIELTKRDLRIVSPKREAGLIKQLSVGGYAIHANKGGSGGHPYKHIDKLFNDNKKILVDYQRRYF